MLPSLSQSCRTGAPLLCVALGMVLALAAACTSAPAAQPAPAVEPEPAAQVSDEAPPPPPEPAAQEAEEPAEAGDEPAEAEGDEADEQYEWLVDDQGRRFRLEALPKEGPFRRMEDGRVRTRWGVTVDVFHEDEDFLYYKIYDVSGIKTEPWGDVLTPEREREIREAFRFETPETDALELVAFDQGLPKSGQWRQGFEVVDMNGDGHLDIVHGPVRKGTAHPLVFLGDGQGNWRLWEAEYPRIKMDYGDVAVADYNGDGRLDIALAMHLTGIRVLVADGEGGYALWTEGTDYGDSAAGGPPVYSARTVEAVDWNQDGRMDILALGEGPRLEMSRGEAKIDPDSGAYGPVVYLNQGDGTWLRRDQGTGADQVFGDALAVGDLDGDGSPDFVTGSHRMGWQEIVFHHGPDGAWVAEGPAEVRDRSYLRSVDLADFDGDGREDLAVAFMSAERDTWRSGVDVLLNRGQGRWERHHVFHSEDREGVWGLAAGDLDGDGRTDLVGTTGWHDVWVFLGDGDGSFRRLAAEEPLLEESPGCRGYHVVLADLDGDGRDEIVAGFAGEGQGWTGLVELPGCPGGGSLRAWDVKPR